MKKIKKSLQALALAGLLSSCASLTPKSAFEFGI